MTPVDQAVMLLHVAINALILWFVWHGPWRRACQERYRQKLFEVRDELFDFARQGGIPFTNPAYVALRSHINGMIRFSHRISVTRLATFILLQRYIGEMPQSRPPLETVLASVEDEETKAALKRISTKVRQHTSRHLLFASPHVLIASPVLYLLNRLISNRPMTNPASAGQKHHGAAISLIQDQARDAYRSEAIKREHENELALVSR